MNLHNGHDENRERGDTASSSDEGGKHSDEIETMSVVLTERKRAKDIKSTSLLFKKQNWTFASFRAFWTSLFEIDYTQIAHVPPLRTAIIMCIEMSLIGIGSNQSTAFRLGALYVGLTDKNGSLSLRLRYMGSALLTTTFFGAVLPGLTWQSSAGLIVSSFLVALLTGLSMGVKFGNDDSCNKALNLSMTLGMALFAVNGGINRTNNGYDGELGFGIFWTFVGGLSSLVFALVPEVIGNRDAVRTNLFQVWNGFGRGLRGKGKQWGTKQHLYEDPVPKVTECMSENEVTIQGDTTETALAKRWLEIIMNGADQIRVASLCFSNVYDSQEMRSSWDDDADEGSTSSGEHDIDSFFLAVGRVSRWLAFALQFPWIVRYIPFFRNRVTKAVDVVDERAVTVLEGNWSECGDLAWLPSILKLIQSQTHSMASTIMDGKTWPPYSPVTTLFQRLIHSLPSSCPSFECDRAIQVHAFRLATAFTLATIPIVAIPQPVSAHWFPMTVALIMTPGQGRTYKKIDHRVFGTFLGLLFGSALAPLFPYPAALIALLGLSTYASVLFLTANYCLFTFFITSWVLVTVVGAGGSSLGWTTLYRCGWTVAAGLLVHALVYLSPPTSTEKVGQQLSAMAKAIGVFAEAVLLEESCAHHQEHADDAGLEAATSRTVEARRVVIKTRIAMLTAIHDAGLTPSKGSRIDPNTLAPSLAADLVSAIVIPQSICLVKDGSADSLLLDFSPHTFAEIDRLSRRLVSTEPISIEPVEATPEGNGPLSNAIARAHQRLDKAGIPSCQDTT